MSKIEQQISHINEKLKQMPTRDEMFLVNEKLVDRIVECSNKKYASKNVEKVVYGMIGAVLLYFLSRILNLV